MLFLSLLLTLVASHDSTPVSAGSPVLPAVNKTVLLQLVNTARKKGCHCGETYYAPAPPLTWNDQLEKAAFLHSEDMFRNRYFSHTGSDGSGSGERISRAGYTWTFYGENIAAGFPDEKQVVEGWLSSPSHCRNIMNSRYTEMGVARVGDYWTQDFARK